MTSSIKLSLSQAIKIRENNYLLADSSKFQDKYAGGEFTTFDLDIHIWELQDREQDISNIKKIKNSIVLPDLPRCPIFPPIIGDIIEQAKTDKEQLIEALITFNLES